MERLNDSPAGRAGKKIAANANALNLRWGSFRIQTLHNCLETLSGPTEAGLNPVCCLQSVVWSLNSRELSEPSKRVNLLTSYDFQLSKCLHKGILLFVWAVAGEKMKNNVSENDEMICIVTSERYISHGIGIFCNIWSLEKSFHTQLSVVFSQTITYSVNSSGTS